MKNEWSKEQTDAILNALDALVEEGGWNSSEFLRVIGKKLRAIRDDFLSRPVALSPENSKITSHLANRVALRTGQQDVFVSLYSSDGANMQAWERIVINLPKQMISRPIYANEEHINQAIRAKEKKVNEAYVAVYVGEGDILPMGDKTPVDKQGQSLLTLKDKSLRLENITRFIHSSGTYQYAHGRLVKDTSHEDH